MTIRQPGDNGYVIRDVALGAGFEAYRAYQATGDKRAAAQAGISGGGTIIGGSLLGLVAVFGYVSALGGFVSGEGGMGALCLLLALFCTWAVIYMVMAHGRRMKRYMAPQRIPAPPGRTSTALARQAQPATSQYTFDLTTGRFHKNW